MADQRYDIIVRDRISNSINTKLQRMAANADRAHAAIQRLNTGFAQGRGNVAAYAASANTAAVASNRLARNQTRAGAAAARSSRGFLTITRSLGQLATIAAGIGAARGIVGALDAFQNLENRLVNVTRNGSTVPILLSQIQATANRARAPITDTARAFQRFDIAMENLGASQQETARLTETVSKLLRLQGSDTNETRSALLQLSQAFNKGKLDGDEFRTVMELMPRAMLAVQNTLGITRAELFKFAEEGRITTDVLRTAFGQIAGETDRAFANMRVTVGQALTVLSNNLIIYLGNLDRSIGLTRGVAAVTLTLANNLDQVARSAQAVAAAMAVAFAPGIVTRFAGAIARIAAFLSPIRVAILAVVSAIVFFREEIGSIEVGGRQLRDVFVGTFNFIAQGITNAVSGLRDFFSVLSSGVSVQGVIQEALGPLRFFVPIINNMINAWRALFNVVQFVFQNIHTVVQDAALFIPRILLETFDTVFNGINERMFQFLRAVANQIATQLERIPAIGQEIANGIRNIFNFEPPRIDFSGLIADSNNSARQIQQVWLEAFSFDFVGVGLQRLGGLVTSALQPLEQSIRQAQQTRLQNEIATNNAIINVTRQAVQIQIASFQALISVIPGIGSQLSSGFSTIMENLVAIVQNAVARMIAALQSVASAAGQVGAVVSSAAGAIGRSLAGAVGGVGGALGGALGGGVGLNLSTPSLGGGDPLGLPSTEFLGPSSTGLNTVTSQVGALNNEISKTAPLLNNASTAAGNFHNVGSNAATGVGNAFQRQGNVLQQAFGSVFGNLTNAIVDFAKTGEFKFEELITSILEDLLRLFLNQLFQQFLGVFGGGVGGFGGGIGGFGGFGGGGLLGGLFGGFGLFQRGGFTGNTSKDRLAGLVHGQEFVVRSAATRGNRPALEHLNRTGELPVIPMPVRGGDGAQMNVVVENHSNATITAQQLGPNDVRIIARQEAIEAANTVAPQVVARDLGDPNSNVSKSMLRNTSARRRRS